MSDQDRTRGRHDEWADRVEPAPKRHTLNTTTRESKAQSKSVSADESKTVALSSSLQALAMAASMVAPELSPRRGKKSKAVKASFSGKSYKSRKHGVQGSYCPQNPEADSSAAPTTVDSLFWHADLLARHEQRQKQDLSAYSADFIANHAANGGTQPLTRYHKRISTILAQGMFRQWMQRRTLRLTQDSPNLTETSESVFYKTAMLLLQNMIFAMRADGKQDQAEQQAIFDLGIVLFHDDLSRVRGEFDRMLTIDLDPESLAHQVEFAEESIDLYLLAAVMLDSQHFLEQSYLENLAACLKIDPTLRQYLNERAHVLVSNEELAATASFNTARLLQSVRQREAM